MEFETHFVFDVRIQTPGKNHDDAEMRVQDTYDDSFISVISEKLYCGMGFDTETINEVKSGTYEVTQRWSGCWYITANDQKEAKEIAEELLTQLLPNVSQAIAHFSDKVNLVFTGEMKHEVTDILLLDEVA